MEIGTRVIRNQASDNPTIGIIKTIAFFRMKPVAGVEWQNTTRRVTSSTIEMGKLLEATDENIAAVIARATKKPPESR